MEEGASMFVEHNKAEPAAPEAGLSTADERRIGIIKSVIEQIRPNLQRDGGDCELVEVCGNKVMVRMSGACVFCKLSATTLEGIQSRIVEELGELVRLIPVMGGVRA
jgi:Fe-S cluster biogenesis protein NfuA